MSGRGIFACIDCMRILSGGGSIFYRDHEVLMLSYTADG
jgi:hypothetical protein